MQVAMTEQSGVLARFLPMLDQSGMGLAPLQDAPLQTATSAADYRVLIMEGSKSLARLLANGLSAESAAVDLTHDLDGALKQLEVRSYHLVILDLDIPEMDGMTLLESLRTRRPDVRVLVLSGRSGVDDLVAALDQGADDYLLKPFSLLELTARARALRRRSNTSVQSAPPPSKLVLYADQCRVERDGREIDLTPREFALLDYMMQNAGKTISRAVLTQQVWNMPVEANTNIVDVYIKYLRDKLDGDYEEKLIRTVRGMGYMLQIR